MKRITERPRALIALLATLVLVATVSGTTTGQAAIASIIENRIGETRTPGDEPLNRSSERPNMQITLTGAVQRIADGTTKLIPVEQAGTIQRGEKINWTITWENKGGAPAHNFKTVGQIALGTTIVKDSIVPPPATKVVYSIDGGKSFSEVPMMDVRQPDGTIKKVPAPSTMFTQVRFETSSPVVAGGRATATYEVEVR